MKWFSSVPVFLDCSSVITSYNYIMITDLLPDASSVLRLMLLDQSLGLPLAERAAKPAILGRESTRLRTIADQDGCVYGWEKGSSAATTSLRIVGQL